MRASIVKASIATICSMFVLGITLPATADGETEDNPEIVFTSFGSDTDTDILASIDSMNDSEDVDAFLDNKQAREQLEDYVSKQQNAQPSDGFEVQEADEKASTAPSKVVTQKAKAIKPSGHPVDNRFRWRIEDSYHVTRCSVLGCHEDAHMNFRFTSGPGKYRDKTDVKFNASSNLIGNPTLTIYVYSKGKTIAQEAKTWPDLKGKTYAQYTFHDGTSLLGRNVQFGYKLHVPAKDSKGHDRSGTAQYRSKTAPKCTGKASSGKAFKCLFPVK